MAEAPLAKRHGVKRITIQEDGGRALIRDVALEVLHDLSRDSLEPYSLHFPVDDLVLYIIERGVADPGVRLRLKQIVRARRERSGEAYQRYKSVAPRRLFIRCKNLQCQRIFETQYTAFPGHNLEGTFEPFACPACGSTNPVMPDDFLALDFPEEKPVDLKGPSGENEKWFSIVIHWRANVFSQIAPLVGRINDAEFEGYSAETVLFLGPQGSSSMPLGRLYFAHRDRSFNKIFREETGTWEEVRHAATKKTLYELADFSALRRAQGRAPGEGGCRGRKMSFPSSFHYENEADFIRRLIVPVLQRLGFDAVTNYHGTREHGKDLVFGETDRFGHHIYHGLQAKYVPSISQKEAGSLIDDARQAFIMTFQHPTSGIAERISKFYVVNGGSISDNVRDLFFQALRPQFGANVRLIDGNEMVALERQASLVIEPGVEGS